MAQISEGGTPLSFDANYSSTFALQTYIPQTEYTAPDINKLHAEDRSTKHTAYDNVRIGTLIPADLSFPSSGTFTTLSDGRQVWRAQVAVAGAPALGFYYDKFALPDGVRYFLSNSNKKQILGAYTSANNSSDGLWVNEKVQGELVNLELDIDANVDVSQIKMHINNVGYFYNSVSYLTYYQTDGAPQFAYDSSSPCEINAICPIGSAYPNQRLASMHIEYVKNPNIYAGSGTVMNNTLQDCTPYVLTASHVEGTNSTANTTFSIWMFYFNYETPTCQYSGAQPTSQSMSGATFCARSSLPSGTNPPLVGDFLLVKLKTKIPATYGAYLSGWDNSGTTPSGTSIGFHHPSGDVKKVSTTTQVFPNGNFNGGGTNTHWAAEFTQGGFEEGSSGSGLFISNGRLIGDLTGGGVNSPTCTTLNGYGEQMNDLGLYSKLSLNWLYAYQTPSSAATRLKDWLDPNNSGAITLDAIAANCPTSAVQQVKQVSTTVTVFPSPSTGIVYVNASFANATTVAIEVLDVVGKKVLDAQANAAQLNNFALDLSHNAAGLYIVHLTSGTTIVTRKVVIAR